GARSVVREDLGEEETQGDPGSIDAIAPAMVAAAREILDQAGTEEVEEGEPRLVAKAVAEGIELITGRGDARLSQSQGELLGREVAKWINDHYTTSARREHPRWPLILSSSNT